MQQQIILSTLAMIGTKSANQQKCQNIIKAEDIVTQFFKNLKQRH